MGCGPAKDTKEKQSAEGASASAAGKRIEPSTFLLIFSGFIY